MKEKAVTRIAAYSATILQQNRLRKLNLACISTALKEGVPVRRSESKHRQRNILSSCSICNAYISDGGKLTKSRKYWTHLFLDKVHKWLTGKLASAQWWTSSQKLDSGVLADLATRITGISAE